jgi:hypothetical protein
MKVIYQRRSVLRSAANIALALCLPVSTLGRAWATELPKPKGKTILNISGGISNTNQGNEAVFDLPMLESLGVTSFSTMTPWYNEKVIFEGVSMARLLEAVGARGSAVSVSALNDYTTEIPISDFSTHQVILAIKRDGAYMPIKDKGPLFIVYNYDSDPQLKHQRFYSRSAWQVAKIFVK